MRFENSFQKSCKSTPFGIVVLAAIKKKWKAAPATSLLENPMVKMSVAPPESVPEH